MLRERSNIFATTLPTICRELMSSSTCCTQQPYDVTSDFFVHRDVLVFALLGALEYAEDLPRTIGWIRAANPQLGVIATHFCKSKPGEPGKRGNRARLCLNKLRIVCRAHGHIPRVDQPPHMQRVQTKVRSSPSPKPYDPAPTSQHDSVRASNPCLVALRSSRKASP